MPTLHRASMGSRGIAELENATPASVFFPMHRVERIELDARNGDIPSIGERFENRTGRDFTSLGGFAAAAGSSSRRKGE